MSAVLGPHVAAPASDTQHITTAAINTSGTKLLVAVVAQYQLVGANPSFISDSKGNTWTGLTGQEIASSVRETIYYVANPIVGSNHTFSYNSGFADFPAMCVASFFEVPTSTPFDQQTGSTATSTTTFRPGLVAVSQDNEFVIAGLGWDVASTTMSIDSDFSIIDQVNYVGGANFGAALAYKSQVPNGNPVWTAGVSVNFAGTNAAFLGNLPIVLMGGILL